MSNLLLWFIEAGKRFIHPSPKFFQVLTWVGGIATGLTGLPMLLNVWNIHVPTAFNDSWNKIIITAGVTTALISKFTVNRAPDGSVKGDKKVLPFTAQNEMPPVNKNVTNKK